MIGNLRDSVASPEGLASTGARALVPALDRAIRILALLEAQPQRFYTVSEIARALDIPKSTAFNICGALLEGQLIRRSREGFQLGRRLIQLGSAYAASVNIVSEFYNACRPVPLDLGATIQLGVLDEQLDTVYLAFQDCNSGLRLGLGGGIGRRVPANCTACGKALLALLPREDLDERLDRTEPLTRLTRKSITSKPRLKKELEGVRETGYAVDDEETIVGLSCVARAVETPHADGGAVAVSISASRNGLTDERRDRLRMQLDAIVQGLGALL